MGANIHRYIQAMKAPRTAALFSAFGRSRQALVEQAGERLNVVQHGAGLQDGS
jgi:hypothetical protein